MKTDQVVLGIIINIDSQLGIKTQSRSTNRKSHRVTFQHDLKNRSQENIPIENQSLIERQKNKAMEGDRLFKRALDLESCSEDHNAHIRAFDLYLEASDLEHLNSIFRLGQIFEEGKIVTKSAKNLHVALDYFSKLKFELLHPKHDEAMDYIQEIYLQLAKMYEDGTTTNQDIGKALECYEKAPYRTDEVHRNIISLSLAFADQLLEMDRAELKHLEKALSLLTDVSYMCPLDTDLVDRIKKLTFYIGYECLSGLKVSQNLQAAFKHLEYLYAEDPEYPDLRDMLSHVIKKGILPYGYNKGNYERAFRASSYFLQFVFRRGDFQKITHDEFIQDLIMDTVTELLGARPYNDEKLDEQATKLWNFILESYDDHDD